MTITMTKLIKQPLLHFLLLGSALFIVFDYSSTQNNNALDDKVIVIDRGTLLTFMQYRSKAFNEQHFSQQLDTMSKEERQRLIDDLVREEVLYREALSLQLNDNDYVIKRRLIQKLEFLTKGFITADTNLTEADINTYYDEHKDEYYVQPYVTFTHVFFDYERMDREQANVLAKKTLEQLNEEQVSFSQAIQYGDRFLYHVNYVERTPDYVSSHFGAEMAESIFNLQPNDKQWQGPYESPYGLHLVMLTKKEPGRFPEVSKIYGWVKDDTEQAMVRSKTEAAINKIINSYDVQIVLEENE